MRIQIMQFMRDVQEQGKAKTSAPFCGAHKCKKEIQMWILAPVGVIYSRQFYASIGLRCTLMQLTQPWTDLVKQRLIAIGMEAQKVRVMTREGPKHQVYHEAKLGSLH